MFEHLQLWWSQIEWDHVLKVAVPLALLAFIRFLGKQITNAAKSRQQRADPASRPIQPLIIKQCRRLLSLTKRATLWLKPHILPFLASYGVMLGLGTIFGRLRDEELFLGFPAAATGATYIWFRMRKERN
jgi:hypothetical protein